VDNSTQKKITDWQQRVFSEFNDDSKLCSYLFETMENFFYRYLETTLHKNLKIQELSPKTFGALSSETNMLEALKIKYPDSKQAIIELAKKVPKQENPTVHYSLSVFLQDFHSESGTILITAEVKALVSIQKKIIFNYHDLTEFRKKLALKLEEACEIFI
jgi:hypothetical protein